MCGLGLLLLGWSLSRKSSEDDFRLKLAVLLSLSEEDVSDCTPKSESLSVSLSLSASLSSSLSLEKKPTTDFNKTHYNNKQFLVIITILPYVYIQFIS
jgi:hypothetical protein